MILSSTNKRIIERIVGYGTKKKIYPWVNLSVLYGLVIDLLTVVFSLLRINLAISRARVLAT